MRCLLFAIVLIVPSSVVGAASAAPTVSAVQSELIVSGTGEEQQTALVLVGKELPAVDYSQIEFGFVDTAGPITLAVMHGKYLGGGPGGQFWLVSVSADGLRPGESVSRVLGATLKDAGVFFVPIKVQRAARVEPNWSLIAPAEHWEPYQAERLELAIVSNGQPLHDVTIVHSAVERTDGRLQLVANDFALTLDRCDHPTVGPIAPMSIQPVYLCLLRSDVVGTFNGVLQINAPPGSVPKSVGISLSITNPKSQWSGIAAMFVGLILSYVVVAYLQRRTARLNAWLPAAVLEDTLDELDQQRLALEKQLRVELGVSKRRIADLLVETGKDYLDSQGFLPKSNPLTLFAADVAGYKAHIGKVRTQLAVIDMVFETALERIANEWSQVDPTHKAAADRLLVEIDQKVQADDTKGLAQELQALLGRFEGLKNGGTVKAKAASVVEPVIVAPRNVESIQVELADLGAGAFLVWAAITLLVGWYIWIYSNPGFGLISDLLVCFFWGLGLPVAGSKLQQLSPASTQSLFRVTVPQPKG